MSDPLDRPAKVLVAYYSATGVNDEPIATVEDLEWADGIAVGTPTRFGNVAAQLKMFVDQAGELWAQGKLINKVATSFISSQTVHGGHTAPRTPAARESDNRTRTRSPRRLPRAPAWRASRG